MPDIKSCSLQVWHGMTRRKHLDKDLMATPLKRCLKWYHLTLFGVGQMAGAGVYVLTGTVARNLSGPATFISYIIAGLCAVFAALCYAEFGARCPKAGSAYTYSYITIGEIVGFSVGWNLLLEHCIGAASTARAWGSALDSLTDNAIKNWTATNIGVINFFGHEYYPDLTSVAVVFILTAFVVYGAELSMVVTGVISVINAITTVIIVIVGSSIGDIKNWQEPAGFAPHGLPGIISGASMLFYAYVGFDAIAMAGEEATNPSKALPMANMLSIGTVMVMYVSMSIALTLAVPYNIIDPDAAFATAFNTDGLKWAKILVNIVMLLVIQGSTISALYAGPRCAYSMASDGLLFRCFAYVHHWTRTPVVAILVFSSISAISAVLLDVATLAEFVSLGTLIASLIVSTCIIIIRYQPEQEAGDNETTPLNLKPTTDAPTPRSATGTLKPTFQRIYYLQLFEPGQAAKYATLLLCLFLLIASLFALVPDGFTWWSATGLALSLIMIALCYAVILMHIQTDKSTTFQIPCVPLLPTISMLVISCLLVRLSPMAWVRFIVWMFIGLLIYFCYGIRNSHERTKQPLANYVPIPEKSSPDNNDETGDMTKETEQ